MGLQWEGGGEATGYSALACPSSYLQVRKGAGHSARALDAELVHLHSERCQRAVSRHRTPRRKLCGATDYFLTAVARAHSRASVTRQPCEAPSWPLSWAGHKFYVKSHTKPQVSDASSIPQGYSAMWTAQFHFQRLLQCMFPVNYGTIHELGECVKIQY